MVYPHLRHLCLPLQGRGRGHHGGRRRRTGQPGRKSGFTVPYISRFHCTFLSVLKLRIVISAPDKSMALEKDDVAFMLVQYDGREEEEEEEAAAAAAEGGRGRGGSGGGGGGGGHRRRRS